MAEDDKDIKELKEKFLGEHQALGKFLKDNEMDVEYDEIERDSWDCTEFPEPKKKFRLILMEHEESLEGMYYWMTESYRQDWGYTQFHKLIDTFAAPEASSFGGVALQRLGLQQDKVSQYLQAIGKMVKELFQFVRELRIIDERLEIYMDTFSEDKRQVDSADISLKGVWIDLVEGGSKNPSSVYGLAREVGFTILPDLFFTVKPAASKSVKKKKMGEYSKDDIKTIEELNQEQVDNLGKTIEEQAGEYNRKVGEVLGRKLRTFHEWKKHTFKELWTRRRFTLQYFRQHYEVIRMYMNWLKPYLKNIKRLTMKEKHIDGVELISGFEGSVVEIEVLATKRDLKWGKYYACGLVNVLCSSHATTMPYVGEGYQRGPKHAGKATITVRAYVWTKEQIEDFKRMRQEEDFEILKTMDESLKLAIDTLGGELMTYLSEAGDELYKKEKEAEEEKRKKEEEEKKKKGKLPSAFEPVESMFSGFKELFGALGDVSTVFGKKKEEGNPELAEKDAVNAAWRAFKNYRKAHRIITY